MGSALSPPTGRSASLPHALALRRRDRERRARRARRLRRTERVRAQGGGPRRGRAAQSRVVQPRGPGARRQRDAHPRERALREGGAGLRRPRSSASRRSTATPARCSSESRSTRRAASRSSRRTLRSRSCFARGAVGYVAPFRLIELQGHGRRRGTGGPFSEATIKLDVGGEVVHTAAEGVGPVQRARCRALRKALVPALPAVSRRSPRRLQGPHPRQAAPGRRRSRASSSSAATATGAGARSGAAPNIIDASWQALADGIEYGFLDRRGRRRRHEGGDRFAPGDGIGPEVVDEARATLSAVARALRARASLSRAPRRGRRDRRDRATRSRRGRSRHARPRTRVLLGAVGGPKWDNPRAEGAARAGAPRASARARPLREPAPRAPVRGARGVLAAA